MFLWFPLQSICNWHEYFLCQFSVCFWLRTVETSKNHFLVLSGDFTFLSFGVICFYSPQCVSGDKLNLIMINSLSIYCLFIIFYVMKWNFISSQICKYVCTKHKYQQFAPHVECESAFRKENPIK